MISPASTNPKVTEVGDYIFRVCFIDPFQGTVMAKFARRHAEGQEASRSCATCKNDYCVGLARVLHASAFTQLRRHDRGRASPTREGDIDFKAQLTAINGASPEAIFVPGYYTDVGLIARQARELGITVPLLGGDGWDSPEAVEIGGDGGRGLLLLATTTRPDDPSPRVQKFVAEVQGRSTATMPDAMAALGYDAAQRAGRRDQARRRDRAARRSATRSPPTKDFPGRHRRRSPSTTSATRAKPAVVLKIDEDGKLEVRASDRLGRPARAGRAAERPVACSEFLQQLVNGLAWGSDLRADRARLHDGLRRPAAHQLRPRRRRTWSARSSAFYAARALAGVGAEPLAGGSLLVLARAPWSACGAARASSSSALAYRPLRRRRASTVLITAIGVSLLARERRPARVRRRPEVLPAAHPARRARHSAAASPSRTMQLIILGGRRSR